MREHNLKKVNVLGVNVCDLRPEKAVALSVEAMHRHGLHTVFFLSAVGSLFCQETPWAMELINSHALVFPGDQHTEMTVLQQSLSEDNGPGRFTDEYMRRFFARMNREYRDLFAVSATGERLDDIIGYFKDCYPNISMKGMVYEKEAEGAADKVVNEINAHIPDVVLLLLPAEDQLVFIKDYETMMNTGLCICLESLHSFITERTKKVPSWMHFLHLDFLYRWMHKEEGLQSRIAGSVYKKRVNEDNPAE